MRHTRNSFRLFLAACAFTFLVLFTVTLRAQNRESATDPTECSRHAVRLHSSQLNELIVKRTEPVPDGLLDKSILHGTVTVEVCVDEHGQAVSIKAISGPPAAFQSVIASVRQWEFRVYERGGSPHAVSGRLKVNFDFQPARSANTH